MSSAWIIWLTFCGLSSGNASNNSRSDLLMLSVSDAVRNGATVVSRFLNPKTSSFLPFVFQKLSEKMKKLDEAPGEKGEGQENELILIMLRLMGVDLRKVSDFAFKGVISLLLLQMHVLGNNTLTSCNESIFILYDIARVLKTQFLISYSFIFVESIICGIVPAEQEKILKTMSQVLLKNEGKRKQRKTSRDFSLLRFILSQPQVDSLLMQMQDPNLVELILKETKLKLKNSSDEDVECIRLLLCRTKPFVRGMQRSLKFFLKREGIAISGNRTFDRRAYEETCSKNEDTAWESANLEDRMYFFAPSIKEVVESGDQCDQLFPDCLY